METISTYMIKSKSQSDIAKARNFERDQIDMQLDKLVGRPLVSFFASEKPDLLDVLHFKLFSLLCRTVSTCSQWDANDTGEEIVVRKWCSDGYFHDPERIPTKSPKNVQSGRGILVAQTENIHPYRPQFPQQRLPKKKRRRENDLHQRPKAKTRVESLLSTQCQNA